jgi:uncharacterized protein YbjQ (UPF0145 family)
MKSYVMTAALALLFSGVADARDTKHMLPIKDAMAANQAMETLGSDVKFFFGPDAPKSTQVLGTFVSNKKTNFVGKTDKQACEWAFLSAMISLRDRAVAEGGNAVVNIESFYKKKKFTSATEYECHAGAVTGGVTLRGTVVKL